MEWSNDGSTPSDGTGPSQTLSNLISTRIPGIQPSVSVCSEITADGNPHNGYADWANLKYNFRQSSNFDSGLHTDPKAMQEMTLDMYHQIINSNFNIFKYEIVNMNSTDFNGGSSDQNAVMNDLETIKNKINNNQYADANDFLGNKTASDMQTIKDPEKQKQLNDQLTNEEHALSLIYVNRNQTECTATCPPGPIGPPGPPGEPSIFTWIALVIAIAAIIISVIALVRKK